MTRLLFVNLPVKDLDRSKAHVEALGFDFDARFTDDECACMVVSGQAYVMLEDRDGVDAMADAALAHGGTPARGPMDHGFMYGRSWHDPDGHLWEVMWMAEEVVERGPADMARSA